MTESKKVKFTAALAGVASFYGAELTQMSLAIYWNTLRKHELEAVQAAIHSHIKDPEHGRFMPKPADIIRHLPADRNPIMGADAAWEVAMRARLWDEDATIVVPKAVFMAFPLAIWNTGDKIAACMAFKDAYPAALAKYGDEVEVSLGLHGDSRTPAIMEAVRRNLITSEMALRVLPHMAMEIAALEPPSKTPLVGGPS